MSDRPEARAKTPPGDGARSDLGQAAHEDSGPRPPQISLLARGSEGDQTRSGPVHRHHRRADAWRPRLAARGDGLVFTQGAGLGRFQHRGNRSLSGSSGKRADRYRPDPENFQHRPRVPIPLRRVDRTPAGSWNKNQQERPRALDGQGVHREALADDQRRGNLSVRTVHGHGLRGGRGWGNGSFATTTGGPMGRLATSPLRCSITTLSAPHKPSGATTPEAA